MNQGVHVKVVQHGRIIQVVAEIKIGRTSVKAHAKERLTFGERGPGESSVDGFMDALMAGRDLNQCFEALQEKEPPVDPEAVKQATVKRLTDVALTNLKIKIEGYIRFGQECQKNLERISDTPKLEIVTVPEGKGRCQECGDFFDLHYIAGVHNLCLKHIPGGYV